MAYINQPPDLRTIQADLTNRLRLLETATRFTAPNVTTDPTNARTGDIWYNTTTGSLRTLLSAVQTISTSAFASTFTALQTFSQGISVANGATITGGNLTISTGNITATAGNITATAGSLSAGTTVMAGTTVTGGTGITATTGNITATAGDFIATAGGLTASVGTVSAANLTSTGTTTVGTFNFSTTTTSTTIGAAGGASALPATPLGYITVKIAGTDRKIPYYNT